MQLTDVTAENVIAFIHQRPKFQRTNRLDAIKQVLTWLDHPEQRVKTIHLTGTNGKGSTAFYLNSLLQQAGQKTGLFISPFVEVFNERIQVNSQNISDQDLADLVNQINQTIRQQGANPENFLTEFEYLVVIGFLYFAHEKVAYAIIEAGIGARHDKTNVITPVVSLLTSVGMDHQELIGPTLADIAFEKAGVIKPRVPVIVGDVVLEVRKIMQNVANELQAPISWFGQDFVITAQNQQFQYQNSQRQFTFALRPQVEQIDVALAVTAFLTIFPDFSTKAIEQAINQTQIVGRYQVLQRAPLVIADGAHNFQAMQNFTNYLAQQQANTGKIYYLVAMMKDKDLARVLELLPATTTTLTTIAYPRAAKLADFKTELATAYHYEADYRQAFQKISQQVTKNDIIAVTGSFYFVSEFLQFYQKGEQS